MSVYCTPLISVSDNDSVSSEESKYFTPEVSSTPTTSQQSLRSLSCTSRRSKSVSDISDVFPVYSPSLSKPVGILNNDVNFRINEWKSACDKKNQYNSSPVKTLELTPNRCKVTPLQCITNIVTPIQVKSNELKFDDKIILLEKDITKSTINHSLESTCSFKNNLLNPKSKCRPKNGSKNKFTFLQRIGIRRKSKVEYDRLIDEDSVSPKPNLLSKINDNTNSVNYQTLFDPQRLNKQDNGSNTKNDILSKYSVNNLKTVDESCSSLLSQTQKKLESIKTTDIWQNVYRYPKVLVLKSIRLSPVKRLFLRCRKKLTINPFRNLFIRKELDEKPANTETDACVQTNPCSCSVTTSSNQELLNKILLKLNTLEDQISDIRRTLKNNSNIGKPSVGCVPPPPPPPLPPPPPPPPLPNLLVSSKEVLKRKATTPNNNQTGKRQGPLKTQFAITVEDIRSVKLRKTPSTIKRSLAGTTQTPSIKDGVMHSVKFKPVKRTVTQKKELSNLVSEILSPSKKTDQSERNCMVNTKLFEDKENATISTNFEITPVTCKNKGVKLRATKRRDVSLDSPTRKRINVTPKTLVFCDTGVLRYD